MPFTPNSSDTPVAKFTPNARDLPVSAKKGGALQFAKNVAGATVQGASRIGSSIVAAGLNQVGIYDSPSARVGKVEQFVTDRGADLTAPEAQVADFTTQVVGTLGIPGSLAKVAPKFADLLIRGGFGAGKALPKAAAGAAVGAATSATLNPSPESISSGSIIGASVPFLLGIPGRYAARGAGFLYDRVSGRVYQSQAGKIAREVVGDELASVKAANAAADPSLLASQAAPPTAPAGYQALLRIAEEHSPDYSLGVRAQQNAANQASIDALAGGESAAAQTGVRKANNAELNKFTTPMRETELNAANTAGQKLPGLNAKVDMYGEAASNKVTDVGRFTAAGERAAAIARTNAGFQGGVPGLPRIPGRYSYFSELATKADEVAQGSADDSLLLGAARRDAEYARDSIAAHGLKPLDVKPLLGHLDAKIASPVVRVSTTERNALQKVADLIRQETDGGRTMDARALYKIRQDGINQAIETLNPGMDAKAQRKLAASMLTKLKPLIDKAIVEAGGTNWPKYLDTYSAGMTLINQSQLGMKLSQYYRKSPQKFIELIRGNNIKDIEKIFGPGSYDVMAEMGAKIGPLQKVATFLENERRIAASAKAGMKPASRALEENMRRKLLPGFLSAKITVTNELLKDVQIVANAKTMAALANAARSGKSMNEVLDALPTKERDNILNFMMNSPRWSGAVSTTAAVGAAQ